jgi:endonuclease III
MRLMSKAAIETLFTTFQAHNPEPKTELEYQSAFQLLIAVLLSAQATDVSVNKATRVLFAKAPDAWAMVQLGLDGITACIRQIGLYKNKAKNALATAQILLREYQGEVPSDRAALEALPGVGRKTANVVLNTFFAEPVMAVDTHIFRVANRMRLAPGADVLKVEKALMRRVPKAFLQHAHHWLILHGRYTCKARNPMCAQCTVFALCLDPERHARQRTEQN